MKKQKRESDYPKKGGGGNICEQTDLAKPLTGFRVDRLSVADDEY
jgi:hypothetical protein